MRFLLLVLYSLIMIPLGRLLSFVGQFHPKLKVQANNRFLSRESFSSLRAKRDAFGSCKLIFVSSAGEYEQARPIMRRLEQLDPELLLVIIFFSESGMKFARSQNEPRPFIKAPWDDFLAWKKLFKVLDPNESIVVRYELWPSFLYWAKKAGPVHLIDGVSTNTSGNSFGIRLRAWLLRQVDRIFLVSNEDLVAYSKVYSIPNDKLHAVGDTKYDRALERVDERTVLLDQLQTDLEARWPRKNRFILGSAWQKDWDLVREVYVQGKKDNWQLIVAPHDVSDEMLAWFEKTSRESGINLCRFSQLDSLGPLHDGLLIDCIGVLPELYGCADVAMVGGALHYRVHNVLEPAVRGLYLCFGPRYHTSKEAVALVKDKLATVVEDVADLSGWWKQLKVKPGGKDENLVRKISSMSGASDRIIASLYEEGPVRG